MITPAAQQPPEEIRRGIEQQVVITLAGQAAERRARRADHDGWRLCLDREQILSLHESAHALAAVRAGDVVHELWIESGTGQALGCCSHSESPDATMPPRTTLRSLQSDRAKVAFWCSVLAMDEGERWKAALGHMRRLRGVADRLVDDSWLEIRALASVLQRKRTLGRHEIAALLSNSPR